MSDLVQGDIMAVDSYACWSYDFDGDRVLINERWPLEELVRGQIVVFLSQKTLKYSEVYGVESHRMGQPVTAAKVITPTGKIGWVMMRHLKRM